MDCFILYFLQCGFMDVLSVGLRRGLMAASSIAELTLGFLTETMCLVHAVLHH
jgi:hypothetical protein